MRTAGGIRRLPVHPLLLTAYPILFLFGRNQSELELAELWLPLLLALAGTAVVFAVLRLLLRDAQRAAVVTSAGVVVFFAYGHALGAVEPLDITAGPLLLAFGLAFLAVVGAVLRRRTGWTSLTSGANLIGALLVGLSVTTIAAGMLGTGDGSPAERPRIGGNTGQGPGRDIYYIILDRYGSERVLRERVGVTEMALYRRLPELGFTVVPDSQANYPQTLHSLASSLNMTYLDEIAAAEGPQEDRTRPLTNLVQEHALGRFLKERGYTYAHLGSWWDTSQTNRLADVNLAADDTSDFVSTLLDTTVVPELTRRLIRMGVPLPVEPVDRYRRHYDASAFAFDHLDELAALPGPKFVFIHILLPHGPYVFGRDGRFLEPEDRAGHTVAELFTGQLAYLDSRIGPFLESIVSVPEDRQPIVVVQADEGPHPRRYDVNEETFQWLEATPEELDEKFGILNAYFLPGDEAPRPYPGISPVNTWRLILSAYFGADLPLLPDSHFVFRDRAHPYDLIDVTDRVRPLATGG